MTQPSDAPHAPAQAQAPDDLLSGSAVGGDGAGLLHGRMLHVSRLATIGEIAAGVAHELNQPLTAIANYAQACSRMLAIPDADLAEVREALREITSQSVRAGDIIRRLRSLARDNRIERVLTDINPVITGIFDLLQSDARVHGAQLRMELGSGLPQVRIDPAQIQHVIINLARNGLEAMEQSIAFPHEIKIQTCRVAEGDVEIAVCDNGPGPEPAVLERMFDLFFSTKANGTGLGLPISSSIARAHGGSLGFRAISPRGSCFFILLPCDANGRPR